ncbi:MAG TPA: response regulator transcription factor [Nocardioides sp.]|nr:response regulator transcription factor [Nocardioides sp.]
MRHAVLERERTEVGMRVLVAEDDQRLAALLEESLHEAGWEVDVVHDGRSAVASALTAPGYDVLLLDWVLPGQDGVSACRRLRELGDHTPALVLTARGEVRDRVAGLEAGADDYLAKPFDLDELLARLRALHRRATYDDDTAAVVGDLVVDAAARTATRRGVPIDLTAREFDILHLLTSRVGQAVTRFDILEEVWDGDTDVSSNVIDVYLARIRAKIDRPFGTSTITTLRGAGYRVDPA